MITGNPWLGYYVMMVIKIFFFLITMQPKNNIRLEKVTMTLIRRLSITAKVHGFTLNTQKIYISLQM